MTAMRVVRALALLSMVLGLAAGSTPAAASEFIGGRPLRIEGYFDPKPGAPDVLEEITVSADGRERRRFGVTKLQAYKPEEEGVQVLRPSTLQPVTLLLRGSDDFVRRFMGAGAEERVVVYGVYLGGPGNFTPSSVEVLPREAGTAR
jgi:hypothetical protein